MSRGGAVRLARQAHNLKVVGSNPTPATIPLFIYFYSEYSSLGLTAIIGKIWTS